VGWGSAADFTEGLAAEWVSGAVFLEEWALRRVLQAPFAALSWAEWDSRGHSADQALPVDSRTRASEPISEISDATGSICGRISESFVEIRDWAVLRMSHETEQTS
jgi:hypothetical protein